MNIFKVGDRVAWVSQASGSTVEKHGDVVEVVAAGKAPSAQRFPRLYQAGVGSPRTHESYVVAVSCSVRVVGRRKVVNHRIAIPYWPVASKLEAD